MTVYKTEGFRETETKQEFGFGQCTRCLWSSFVGCSIFQVSCSEQWHRLPVPIKQCTRAPLCFSFHAFPGVWVCLARWKHNSEGQGREKPRFCFIPCVQGIELKNITFEVRSRYLRYNGDKRLDIMSSIQNKGLGYRHKFYSCQKAY